MIMRILVIEDEHKIAGSIKKGLEMEKYAVDVAFDGSAGFDLAASEEYDAIVLDLMLPVMDGMTVCKNLRTAGIHTPVLMLTAKGTLDDKVTGLNNGADDYLVKPFAFDELLARIKALTRRPKIVNGEKLLAGGIELNSSTYEVTVEDKEVILSRKEFSVLEYLLRNKNRVLSKDQIISHIWNYEADILPNTVEVFIRNIRNKIGKTRIKTVRGFGYKIDDKYV